VCELHASPFSGYGLVDSTSVTIRLNPQPEKNYSYLELPQSSARRYRDWPGALG